MTLFTIKVPASAKSRIAQFVKELGGEVVVTKPHGANIFKKNPHELVQV